MAEVCFIILLSVGGAVYLSLRFARCNDKSGTITFAVDLGFFLLAASFIYKFWWKLHDSGVIFLSWRLTEKFMNGLLLFIVFPLLLVGNHAYIYCNRALLPRAVAFLIWPSLILYVFTIGSYVFLDVVGIPTIHDVNRRLVIFRMLEYLGIAGLMAISLYGVFLACVSIRILKEKIKIKDQVDQIHG